MHVESFKKSVRTGKAAKTTGDSKVLGITHDGVRILKPKGKATHFTQKELREAIASVRNARRA